MPETIISQYARAYNSPIETNRQVNTSTDRDNISSSVRWRGMLVHVIADDVTYELVGGIDNGSWQPLAGLQDAPSDGETYGRKDGAWEIIDTSIDWGDIGGTLADQTDLQSALDAKAPLPTYTEVFALISQSGTSVPTAEILRNTTGGLSITRQGVGLYHITPGDYVQSDTYVSATITSEGTAQDLRLKISKQASFIQFATYSSGVLADNVINQMSLNIKVFS